MAENVRFVIEVDDQGSPQIRRLRGEFDATRERLDRLDARLGGFRTNLQRTTGTINGIRQGFSRLQATIVTLDSAFNLAERAARTFLAPFRLFGRIGQDILRVGGQFQFLQTRLTSIIGDADRAAQAFERIQQVASRTPFSLQAVTEAAITLRAFGEQNEAALTAIADLAAFMGTTIPEAAQAYGRAFAAGAGAADILRERGVLALIQTRAGVDDLTKLSLPEFRRVLFQTLIDPSAEVAGAADRLSRTLVGAVSNVQDRFDRFRDSIARAGFLDLVVDQIDDLLRAFDELDRDGTLDALARDISEVFEGAVRDVRTFIDSFTPEDLRQIAARLVQIGEEIVTIGNVALQAAGFVARLAAQIGLIAEQGQLGRQIQQGGFGLAEALEREAERLQQEGLLGPEIAEGIRRTVRESLKTGGIGLTEALQPFREEIRAVFDQLGEESPEVLQSIDDLAVSGENAAAQMSVLGTIDLFQLDRSLAQTAATTRDVGAAAKQTKEELERAKIQARLLADAVAGVARANRAVVEIQREIDLLRSGLTGSALEAEKMIRELVRLNVPRAEAETLVTQLIVLRGITEESGEAARETTEGFINLFDELERGASQVFDALILGTRSVDDAFKGLGIAMVRSLSEAFVQGLRAKAGFDRDFQVNIFGLVRGVGQLLTGQGGLSEAFAGVFQTGAAGGGAAGAGGLTAVGLLAAGSLIAKGFVNAFQDQNVNEALLAGRPGAARERLARERAGVLGRGADVGFGVALADIFIAAGSARPIQEAFEPSGRELRRRFAQVVGDALIDGAVSGARRFRAFQFTGRGGGRGQFGDLGPGAIGFGAILAGRAAESDIQFAAELARAAEEATLDLTAAIEALGIGPVAALESLNRVFEDGNRQVNAYDDAITGLVSIFTRLEEPEALRIANRLLEDGVVRAAEMRRVMRALNESIEITGNAFSQAGGDINAFIDQLATGVIEDFTERLQRRLIERGPFGAQLTETIAAVREGLRQAQRRGGPGGREITAEELQGIAVELGDNFVAATETLADLAPIFESITSAQGVLNARLLALQGEFEAAADAILEGFNVNELIASFEQFQDTLTRARETAQRDTELVQAQQRLTLAATRTFLRPGTIQGPNFPPQLQGLPFGRANVGDLLSFLQDVRGGTLGVLGPGATQLQRTIAVALQEVVDNPQRALELLNELGEAQVELLELQIDEVTQLRDVFASAADAFGQIRENVDIIRRGPRARADILEQRRARAEELLPTALQGNVDAIQELQGILPEILNLAQQTLGPGSPAFRELLDFVDTAAEAVGGFAETELGRLTGELDTLNTNLTTFLDAFGVAVDAVDFLAGGQFTADLAAGFEIVRTALVGEDGLRPVLVEIRDRLDSILPAQGGGFLSSRRTFLVGEQGPELFVPQSAGRLLSGADTADALASASRMAPRQDVTLNVQVGPITIQADGSMSDLPPEQIARAVADAVRVQAAPQLIEELERALDR